METKKEQLLRLLDAADGEFITPNELGEITNLSTRTVLRYIKALMDESSAYGFAIEKCRGRGYRLKITDGPVFETTKRLHMQPGAFRAPDIVLDAVALLLTDGSIKLDDLAERQNYSRSSISRITPQISALLSPFHLRLESKAHKGLQLIGGELSIRAAMMRLLFDGSDLDEIAQRLNVHNFDCFGILHTVLSFAKSRGFEADEKQAERFLRFALLSAYRTANGNILVKSDNCLNDNEAVSASSIEDVKRLLELDAMGWAHSSMDEQDIVYLSLAWEQCFFSNFKLRQRYSVHPDFYREIVLSAFHRIKANYQTDFFNDDILTNGLEQHIAASYGRNFLGIDDLNPYAGATQSRYPVAHYYALELAEELSRTMRMPIFEGELALLTLYFAAASERCGRDNKTRAAIVCSAAFGTAELLKSRLSRQFDNLDVVGVYSMEEVKKYDLRVDLYISTTPSVEKNFNDKPLLQLSPFLDDSDIADLEAALARIEETVSINDCFSSKSFFIIERPMKKNVALNLLCEELIERELINPADKEAIFEREELFSTEVTPLVAMPHCIIRGKSMLAFALLKSPIYWGKSKVQLVMMGFFQVGDARIKVLLKQFYRLFSSDERVNSLLACGNYAEFAKTLNAFLQGGDEKF